MKILLSMLIKKFNDEWWEIRTATGSDPDNVQAGHFTFSVAINFIKRKLRKVVENHDEKHS